MRALSLTGCRQLLERLACAGQVTWAAADRLVRYTCTGTYCCSCTQQQDDRVLEPLIQNGKEALGRHSRVGVGAILLTRGFNCIIWKTGLLAAAKSLCKAVDAIILLTELLLVLVL